MDDDPREVLELLNSLGFIGITAEQLKAFMKDLKLYRKIKDRERQQKKEEIKKKIIDKQHSMIKEVLREQEAEFHLTENTVSSTSSSSYVNGSHIKVKVKCLSSEKENRNFINAQENCTSTRQKFNVTDPTFKSKRILDHYSPKSDNILCDNKDDKYYTKSKRKSLKCLKEDNIDEKGNNTKIETRKLYKEKPICLQSAHPMSAPSILEHHQDNVASSRTKSTSPKNPHSGKKSFIRPWRLQPDVQKSLSSKKSDPVTLFQKYQQEWKQISFPGEAKHASVRWAIREKMLGKDPHPIPLPKRSSSMPTLKRK